MLRQVIIRCLQSGALPALRLHQQQQRQLICPSFLRFCFPLSSSGVRHCTSQTLPWSSSSDAVVDHETGDASIYFDSSFWDKTYSKDSGASFEWYRSYSELSSLLARYVIPKTSPVLMVGCGNSLISEDMVKDGYKEIVNIDISQVVIEAMQKKYQNVPQLKYMVMNAVDLSSFADSSFGSVIDKGTLDAIMCDAGGPYNAAMMLGEISRILKPGGVYMLITFAGPEFSLPLLNKNAFGWDISLYLTSEKNSNKDPEQSSKAYMEVVPLNLDGSYSNNYTSKSSNNLFIYICTKP